MRSLGLPPLTSTPHRISSFVGAYEHKRIADVSLSCLQALGLGWGANEH